MDHKPAISSFVLIFAAIAASPASAQTKSVYDQLCDQVSVKQSAAKLTRDWGERFQQNGVEQVVQTGWVGTAKAVEFSKIAVTCRISFRNTLTDSIPARRIEIQNLDFRYTEPNGNPQIEALTLPLSGMDQTSAILAVWERLFINEQSLRSILEAQAEHDPKLAAGIGEILNRSKPADNRVWEPDKFCASISAAAMGQAITLWAENTNQVRVTGLTSKETPSWLPATDWKVINLKAVSSIPFQSAICSADVSYTANKFGGNHTPMEIRGMTYRIFGSGDRSQNFVETHNWPNEQQSKDGDNTFNHAWVVNGRTFAQDAAAQNQQQSGKPKNIIEAFDQMTIASYKQLQDYAKSQGYAIDSIDKIKHDAEEKTRKYAEPCRQSGGTWGYPQSSNGRFGDLGCYHPTGER